MRREISVVFIFLLSILLFESSPLFGGDISPNLELKLARLGSDELQSCLLVMKNQARAEQLGHKLNLRSATRQKRHQEVLNVLKGEASSSQSEIINYLEEEIARGTVKEFKALWITNSIFLRATKTEIEKIASRKDVETIYEDYPISLVDPVSVEESSGDQTEKESCFSAIGVREAWSMGYNGKGRLVCNLDTGVDGDHEALFSNWRGNNGGSAAASWFHPYGSDFPQDKKGHGTHTMGTMVGISEEDTIGVAFGAQWIAAGVIDQGAGISQTISDILGAFQWAVDPDGNPETVDDVPDVISNSWGIPPGCKPACDETFWAAIDNVENAGIVVIFAAGNEGPDSASLRTPADRISSPLNCFSVGAIDATDPAYPVASFSSRGPSRCDNQTKKPEICAPGVNVFSCYRDNQYRLMSGTSMSAPIVAGAVAILRQYNPDATVDQIKQAFLESAIDLGPAGEDNSYGMGLMNIQRALELLPKPDSPDVHLKDFTVPDGDLLQPGDDANIIVNLENAGRDMEGVFALLCTSEPLARVILDSVDLGKMPKGEEVSNAGHPFQVHFDENMPRGRKVRFVLQVGGDVPRYSREFEFCVTVGSLPLYSVGNHDAGNFIFTISNFGQYGLGNGSFNPIGGEGLVYPKDGSDVLYEASLLIGKRPDQVSDGARGDDGKTPEQDFQAFPGGDLILNTPGSDSDQDGFCIFSDQKAENPLGLKIIQKSFSYADPENDDYLILEYIISNINQQAVEGVYVGLFFDWNIPLSSPDDDKIGFDSVLSLWYQYDSEANLYLSLVPLGGDPENRVKGSFSSLVTPIDNSLWLDDGFTEQEKYLFLSGELSTNPDFEAKNWSQLASCGPFSLAPQKDIVFAFAVVGGESLAQLQANVSAAHQRYQSIATSIDDGADEENLPESFCLGQNYPNPFNPVTTIPFELRAPPPERNGKSLSRRKEESPPISVSLRIHNILGQVVKTVFEGELPAGRYQLSWDGRDENGARAASGIYLCKLKTGQGTVTRKMILLK